MRKQKHQEDETPRIDGRRTPAPESCQAPDAASVRAGEHDLHGADLTPPRGWRTITDPPRV